MPRLGFTAPIWCHLRPCGTAIVRQSAQWRLLSRQSDRAPERSLARDGLSNPEIGARLALSPRTVEWHLRNVFNEFDIRSRRELVTALPDTVSEAVLA